MNSNNTVLLVIDVINSCAHEKCEIPEWKIYFSKIREMVPKLKKFIEEFKKITGGPVIYGKTKPWNKEYLAENVNELYEDVRFSYYSKDASGFPEEFYLIKPEQEDLVFDKDTNDALTNPDLIKWLEGREIKYLVITGVFTDGCVLATVVGGFSKGYNIIVLRDLCETTDVPIRQLIQEKMFEFTFPYMFARVVNSADLLERWS
jgi:nicotinamidase-related amidase